MTVQMRNPHHIRCILKDLRSLDDDVLVMVAESWLCSNKNQLPCWRLVKKTTATDERKGKGSTVVVAGSRLRRVGRLAPVAVVEPVVVARPRLSLVGRLRGKPEELPPKKEVIKVSKVRVEKPKVSAPIQTPGPSRRERRMEPQAPRPIGISGYIPSTVYFRPDGIPCATCGMPTKTPYKKGVKAYHPSCHPDALRWNRKAPTGRGSRGRGS
jgi:hypothetical protein